MRDGRRLLVHNPVLCEVESPQRQVGAQALEELAEAGELVAQTSFEMRATRIVAQVEISDAVVLFEDVSHFCHRSVRCASQKQEHREQSRAHRDRHAP